MEILLVVLGCLAVFMTLLYGVSLVLTNNGVADVGYGIACMVVVASTLFLAPLQTGMALALATLPFIWGTRLALRIAKKNYGKPEDFRYKAWRDQWGSTFLWRSYLQVYLLQGVVIFLVALPVTLALVFPATQVNHSLVYTGLVLWVVGFFFETVGDYQLDRFIANPANKGAIMTTGLWKYTRHPNYFGESAMWWGIALSSLGISAYGIFGFISPLLITYLLLFVSGIPMLEKRWEGNQTWEVYKRKTSAFVPWFPRS